RRLAGGWHTFTRRTVRDGLPVLPRRLLSTRRQPSLERWVEEQEHDRVGERGVHHQAPEPLGEGGAWRRRRRGPRLEGREVEATERGQLVVARGAAREVLLDRAALGGRQLARFGFEAEQQLLRGMGRRRLEEEMQLGPRAHLGGALRTTRIVSAELGPLRAGGARHEVHQIEVEGAPAAHLTPMCRSRARSLMAHPPRSAAAAPGARRAAGASWCRAAGPSRRTPARRSSPADTRRPARAAPRRAGRAPRSRVLGCARPAPPTPSPRAPSPRPTAAPPSRDGGGAPSAGR